MTPDKGCTEPIFDQIFGWIYPVGGGVETAEETAQAKAEAEAKAKAETEAKAKAEAEAKAKAEKEAEDQKNAGTNAEQNAKLKKEIEELAKYKKDAEEKAEKDRIEKLDGEEKQKAIAEAEAKKREAVETENAKLKIDNAIAAEVAKLAAEGKHIIPEFLKPVEKVEDIPEMVKKAFEHQEEVVGDKNREENKFPDGGGGHNRSPKVQGADQVIAEYKKYKKMTEDGDRSRATSNAWQETRTKLTALGIDYITLKPIPKE